MTHNENTAFKQECSTRDETERIYETRLYRPNVDIVDAEGHIVLIVDLPGVDENSVDVSLEKNVLTIRGDVPADVREGFELVHAEYGVGDFERSFTLSDEVDREGIDAQVKDGVLTLELSKVKAAPDRKITVQAG